MEEPIASSPAPRTTAEYRAAIDALRAEMKRRNEQSDRTRAESGQLKFERRLPPAIPPNGQPAP
jgi:hypothetical protein